MKQTIGGVFMKRFYLFLLFFCMITVIFMAPSHASCRYDGQTYEEGTRLGSYTCREGKWERNN